MRSFSELTLSNDRPFLPATCRSQHRAIASSFLRGLELMTVLARRPEGLQMSILTRKLALPRTTVLRMLSTLERYGLATKTGKVWCLSDLFYEWTSRSSHEELRDRYRPVIHRIASEVDELVELGVSDSRTVRYIYWEKGKPEALPPIKATVAPLHKTACGKLFISQQPSLSPIGSSAWLRAEISAVLRNGVAWNRCESDPNVVAVATWAAKPSAAAPVICVKWPYVRFTEAKGARALEVVRRELAQLHS